MSRKKIAIAAAGVIAIASAAVVYAQGHRGGMPHDGGHGGMMMLGDEHGREMRTRFGRSLTKDEFDARVRARFARIDRNSDNVIDAAEIEAMVDERMNRRFMGRGDRAGKSALSERALRRFDADRDGKVTPEEMRAEFARRFAEMDLNGDGRIDDADLPPLMRGRNIIAEGGHGFGHRRGGRGMMGLEWLRRADANNDGVVTREEMDAFAAREHARLDRNNDGVVDQADRDHLRREMVDYAVRRFAHRHGAGPDNIVTREQFQARANERFARLDLDGDGTISRDEMPRGWGRGGHGHGRGGWRDWDGGPRGAGEREGLGPRSESSREATSPRRD